MKILPSYINHTSDRVERTARLQTIGMSFGCKGSDKQPSPNSKKIKSVEGNITEIWVLLLLKF